MNVKATIRLVVAGLISENVLTVEQGERMLTRLDSRFSGQALEAYDTFTVGELASLISDEDKK